MATQLKEGVVHQLAPNKLTKDPTQPRKVMDKAKLAELAASIKQVGMLQPIVVRQHGAKVFVVSGERRLRAAVLAKQKTVPCIVGRAGDSFDRAVVQISENEQREALNPMDVARFLVDLQKREKKSVNELVGELAKRGMKGVAHARVEKMLRFVELPAWAQKHLQAGELDEAHATVMLQAIPYPAVMKELQGEIKRQLQWTGSVAMKDLNHDIDRAYSRVGRPLKDSWGEHRRLFDIKVCKGCEFKKAIGNNVYCMNPPEFDKKNAERRQALLLKEQKQQAKARGVDPKTGKPKVTPEEEKHRAKRKVEILDEKLSRYLDQWLRPRVMACVAERASGLQVYGLTYWMATGAVHSYSDWGTGQRPEKVAQKTRALLHASKVGDLGAAMAFAMDAKQKSRREKDIAQAAVSVMEEDQLRWFAREQLKFDLLKEGFRIDLPYLNLFRKQQLIDLAVLGGLEPKGAGGLAQLKRDILEPAAVKKIGVPKHLADLYAKKPKAVPASVFKNKAPTDHDQLLHELGLDDGAAFDDIVSALNVQAEERARKLVADADKAAAAKAKDAKAKGAKSKKKTRKKAA